MFFQKCIVFIPATLYFIYPYLFISGDFYFIMPNFFARSFYFYVFCSDEWAVVISDQSTTEQPSYTQPGARRAHWGMRTDEESQAGEGRDRGLKSHLRVP